jgi:threonine/homoserine/homoserine lactone efflux protein
MFGIADYGAFVVAVIVFLAIPGPGNLALLGATAHGGVRSGMAATLGVIAGDQTLLWLAVSGLSALLAAYPAAFQTIQWIGAIYLVWLGAKLLRTRLDDAPALELKPDHFFKQAFFITVLNPKAIVFYMAFFSAFCESRPAPRRHHFCGDGCDHRGTDSGIWLGHSGERASVGQTCQCPPYRWLFVEQNHRLAADFFWPEDGLV